MNLRFNPTHELLQTTTGPRCCRCGMTYDEIKEYRSLLCPVGNHGVTKRAHFQFSIPQGGEVVPRSNPHTEVVVYGVR